MNAQIIAALARHILTTIAGGFFLKYGVDGGAAEAIIGGASALAGVGWSIYDKKKGA
jgi:hypothetical protein